MVNTRYIHFRVTREQYAAIKVNANLAGCKTVSDYLRNLALNETPLVQDKLVRLEANMERLFELLKSVVNGTGK